MWLLRPPGVYAPQDDTSLLREALLREPAPVGARVLDVGTGTGALALAAARRGAASVTAVDTSRRAVLTTKLNALLAGLPVRVRHGDLFGPVHGQTFDLVLANPPYVVSPHAYLPRRGPARAWDAGRDGRALLDRICAQLPPLLRPGGVALTVHSALCDPDRTVALLRAGGLDAEVTDRRPVPFGPVMSARADWLRDQGLLGPDDTTEELAVVRAERIA
ncbi:HemK2/MTQ2 family protein methyltransferase [Streptomyces johnsoniae]|uniref:Methyltransferase n=1 Tax=Streptomyces johnsoniae TaxID=3075532 RepID=A0ABU2RXZ9_9ACTN|nr:HemK2/MTQ2 family protein methyltransferase [Streptomyces sp. DSM 41886]MDT0441638.1 methyltransferase [Streptomyces sp. DSM 41886]